MADAIRHAPWADAPADFAIGLRPIPPEANSIGPLMRNCQTNRNFKSRPKIERL